MPPLSPNLAASSTDREIYGNGAFLINYQLKNKHVLVIGGGKEAANRTFFALDSSAKVTLIAPLADRHPAVEARVKKGLLEVYDREFKDSDLDLAFPSKTDSHWNVDMVLCCIDDPVESRRIALLARSRRIPVNCADIPELCDFYFMAQYRARDLQIGVSTNGGGPRLGARIRNDIVKSLNPSIPLAVTNVGELRAEIRKLDLSKNSNNSGLRNRMGWISRFCDSWSYEQLKKLGDTEVKAKVIESFLNNQSPEAPLIEQNGVSSFSNNGIDTLSIPPQLTSSWWCPSIMGYRKWIKMIIDWVFKLAIQTIYLVKFHLLLLIKFILGLNTLEMERVKVDTPIKKNIVDFKGENNHSAGEVIVASTTVHRTSATSSVEKESKEINTANITAPRSLDKKSSKQLSIKSQPSLEFFDASDKFDLEGMNISPMPKSPGTLLLVGAGPGEPDMLTIQAIRVLMAADLVVSDRLIPPELHDVVHPDKLVLSSFKVGGKSDESQDETNQICLDALQRGKMVVRFKTGDAFVFARGGEEILFFRKYGIEPVIVPGISSVFAAPAYNLIPITHRGVADQVLVLSGRGQGGTFPEIPEYYARRTTIILMSLSRLKGLANLMIERGYPIETPCAVIEKGTWREGEKVCEGTLGNITRHVLRDDIKNPAMFVVGDVVNCLQDSRK